MNTTLGSASQSSATAIEHNDNLSSPQNDKADTDMSFYSTRNELEDQIGETTTFIPAPIPSPPLPSRLSMISEISEQTYGTQVSVDEHDENRVRLAFPPSDGTNASQLPPLVPVRRRSKSQPNGRTQSTTTFPPVAQKSSIKVSHAPTPVSLAAPQDHPVPSQYSQGWYRAPTAQTPQIHPPRTSGNIPGPSPRRSRESWNSDRSPSLTPQRYSPPLQQSAPNIPSMYSRMPSQPYGPSHNVVTPQPHSSGPTQPILQSALPQSHIISNGPTPQSSWSTYEGTHQQFVPQPAPTQRYHLPGSPRPQSQPMYAGVSQPFISQRSRSPFGRVPSRQRHPSSSYSRPIAYDSIGPTTNPQTSRKANAFVASDPFRVTNRKEKVSAPSDGLTFDDIPTAGSLPGPAFTGPSRSYSLPIIPTQSRYAGTVPYSNSLPIRPIPQAQSIHEDTPQQPFPQPVPSPYYSTSNTPKPQTSQPIYSGTPQQFIPQPTPSQFYSNPNTPAPQAQPIYTGAPRQSQMSESFPGASYVRPTPLYPTGYNFTSQVNRRPSFVANDPFQVSYGSYGAAVDAPSNFDDVSTARSYSPEPRLARPYRSSSFNQPTFGGYYYPGAAPPLGGSYGQSHILTQPGPYSTFNDSRPWYQPESRRRSRSRHRSHHRQPTPPTPEYDDPYKREDVGLVQPHLPSTQPGDYFIFNEPQPWYQPEIRHSRSRHHSHHRQPTPPTPEDDAFKREDIGLTQPHLPSTQPGYYSNEPQPWYEPEIRHSRSRHRSHHRQPTPPTPEYDPYKREDIGLAQPHLPSTQPGYYSTSNEPRLWYQPETRYSSSSYYANAPLPGVPTTQIPIILPSHRHHRHHRQPTPPTPEYDASKQEDTGLAQLPLPSTPDIQLKLPISVFSPPVQSQTQERREEEEEEPKKLEEPKKEEEEEERRQEEEIPSAIPSTHHSPIIAPNADDTVTPPAVPVNRPPSPSRSQDIPFTRHEPYMGASQSSFGSSVFDPYYHPYPTYLPYLQYPQYQYPQYQYSQYQYPQYLYPQYQYPNLPKKSIFSGLNRFFRSSHHTHPPANPQPFTALYPQPFTEPYTVIYPPMDPEVDWHESVFNFFLTAFPKQMYLLILLRLPSLYFSRVARIFEEADMSLPEIKKMALETASRGLTHEFEFQMAFESPSVPPAYKRLTLTWESFIDSVMREWKTFNIISVLLLSAILTILQIESAADDPLIRYTALFSLMCALISLLFGCMYIIRFGSMRKSYKAAEWALEAKKSKTLIWWNVWILLAMPAIWLTWSIILYIACIMSFIWRTGVTSTTPPGLSDTGLLAIRIVMTVVLGIGVLYGLLIMTTFQRYGRVMDKAWKQRIDEWIEEKANGSSYGLDDQPYPQYYPGRSARHRRRTHSPLRYYYGDVNGRYPRNTYAPGYYPSSSRSSTPPKSYGYPAYPPIIIPLSRSTSSKSDDSTTINRHGPNQPVPQLDPKRPIAIPPKLIPERTLYPIIESSITNASEDGNNALGFSSGLENRSNGGDDAPDDGNHVRFRLPSGSSDISDDWQGIYGPKKKRPPKHPKR